MNFTLLLGAQTALYVICVIWTGGDVTLVPSCLTTCHAEFFANLSGIVLVCPPPPPPPVDVTALLPSSSSSSSTGVGSASPQNTLVFIAGGQSNMVSNSADGYPFGADTPYASPYVTQLGRYNGNNLLIIPAVDPLDYINQFQSHSQAITFGYNTWLHTGQNITIIPCAVDGTGFSGFPNWVPVDINAGAPAELSLYYDCTTRTNYVLSLPGYTLAGIIWDQGEADATINTPASVWLADIQNLVTSWRRDLIGGANVSFVAVQLLPAFAAVAGGTYPQIQLAINSIPFNIPLSSVVYGLDSSGYSLPAGDGGAVHYAAVSEQALGFLDYYAWVASKNNFHGSLIPGQIVQVFTLLFTATTANISWTPDPIATAYQVWLNGSMVVAQSFSKASLTNLVICTMYIVNVTGVGPTGVLGNPSLPSIFFTPCNDTLFFFPLLTDAADTLNTKVQSSLAQATTVSCHGSFVTGTLPSGASGTYLSEPCDSLQAVGVATNVYLSPSFTVSAWFQPTTAGSLLSFGFLFGTRPVTSPNAYFWVYLLFLQPAVGIQMVLNSVYEPLVYIPALPVGAWTMFTVTHNSTTQLLMIYVNGSVVATFNSVSTGFSTNSWGWGQPLQIGGNQDANPYSWNGGISAITVTNTGLSVQGVATLYTQGSQTPAPLITSFVLPLSASYSDPQDPSLFASYAITPGGGCNVAFAPLTLPNGAAGNAYYNPCQTVDQAIQTNAHPSASFTVSLWIKPLSWPSSSIIFGSNQAELPGSMFFYFQVTGGTIQLIGTLNSVHVSTTTMATPFIGVWSLLTVVHDATTSNLFVYVNGALVAGSISSAATGWSQLPPLSTAPIAIGGTMNELPYSFIGSLYNATLYNYSLSGTQVAYLYSSGSIPVNSSTSSNATVFSSLLTPRPMLDYEANVIPSSLVGAPISLWPDATTNQYNATQSVSLYQPELQSGPPSQTPWLLFSGSTHMAGPAVFPVSSDYSVVVMVQVSTISGSLLILSGTSNWGIGIISGYLQIVQANFFFTSAVLPVPVNVPTVFTFSWNNGLGQGAYYYNTTNAGTASGGPNTDNGICVGAFLCRQSYFAGDIFAILVYNVALTAGDVANVNTFLFNKYNNGT